MDTSIAALVVDDSSTLRVYCVSEILQKIGFQNTDTAADGLGALLQMKKLRKYGLVVSGDVEIEPMNGIELLKAVREDNEMRDICVCSDDRSAVMRSSFLPPKHGSLTR